MSDQKFDVNRFKEESRNRWNTTAPGWQKWRRVLDTGSQPMSDLLIRLAGIEAGHNVLDVATGTGEPTFTVANHVGASGRVVAIDQAQQMIDFARERAALENVENVEFHVMDAETAAFTNGSFDTILCRCGLMFLPNLDTSLKSLRDSLAPGGKLAASVWSVPERVPMLSIGPAVLRSIIEMPAPPVGSPNPFDLAVPGALEKAFEQAGFSDLKVEKIILSYEFASTEEYMDFHRDLSTTAGVIADHPEDVKASVWQAIEDAVKPYAQTGGRITLANEALCIVGTK